MRRAGLALVLALACLPVLAGTQLKLLPVRGLFLPPAGPGLIEPAFREAIPAPAGGAFFQAEFRKAFPEAVSAVADKDRRFTLVSSLQISRAAHYAVGKVDGTSDILVPVSGSLYFTNAVSGEVLYTVASTYYARASVAGDEVDPGRLNAMFTDAYHGLVGELLAKARAQFKPRTVAATVRREWHGLYLLDHGEDVGIAKGDSLSDAEGNTLDVLFTAPGYAVGRLALGKVAPGASFARDTNADVAQLRRPRVMVLPSRVPGTLPAEIVTQLFTDALGAKAALNVVQVNPMFSAVLQAAFAGSGLSNEHAAQRELPDYFLRLSIPEARSYELQAPGRDRSVRSYRSVATAELVDRSGRVVFATTGSDRADDQVVAGMALDEASRLEVSVKNALLDLAQRIGTDLKFQRAELPLQGGDKQLVALDRDGVLAAGDQLTLYRTVGHVDGIAGDVRVPLADAQVQQLEGASAALSIGLPFGVADLAPRAGDVVLIDATPGTRGASRRRFAACGAAVQLGAIELPGFGELAINALAKGFRAPFYSNAVFSQALGLVGPDSRFKSRLQLGKVASDYCVEPVYRVDPGSSQCGGSPRVCQDTAVVRVTYRIRRGDDIAARNGLEARVTGAGYLEGAPEEERRRALEADIVETMGRLCTTLANDLNKQTFN